MAQRSLLAGIARVNAVALGLLMIIGLLVQLVAPGPGAASEPVVADGDRGAAYLRVVADPWAEIWVDGLRLETTPVDRRLPVPAGVRWLKLVNPYYREYSERLELEPGEVREIRVRLDPASPAARR